MITVKPVIAITSKQILNAREVWAPAFQGQAHTYVDAVLRAGGVPLFVPFIDDENALRQLYQLADGIIFSGGNDIDPKLYGIQNSELSTDISEARDKQELLLYEWCFEDKKPILAVCRGMQLLNVFLGGTLYEDIPLQLPQASDHNISGTKRDFEYVAHNLKVDPDSKLASILGATQISANALHHQAIKDLGKGLQPVAWAEDGVIEAVEMSGEQFIIGIQSHPEVLESSVETKWRKIFNEFVARTSKARASEQAPELAEELSYSAR